MDVTQRVARIREEGKTVVSSLSNAFEECDTPEELEHLNAIVQAQRQNLNTIAYLIGLAMAERKNGS